MGWWLFHPQACLSGSFGDADDDDAYFPKIRLRIQDLAHAMHRMGGWVDGWAGAVPLICEFTIVECPMAGLASAHPLQMTS